MVVTEPPEGTFIKYSTGTAESALDQLDDADHNPNSVFTRNLLPLLKTPSLWLTEIAEQVRVAVRQMAATVQHRQTPAYYNQVLGRVSASVERRSASARPTFGLGAVSRMAVAISLTAASEQTAQPLGLYPYMLTSGVGGGLLEQQLAAR